MIALILGGAKCVWEDIEKALSLFTPDRIIAINDVGAIYKNVDDWVTMHPEKMALWLDKRIQAKLGTPKLWTAKHKLHRSQLEFNGVKSEGGGSGLLAVRVARHLGAASVLAGVPMDPMEKHFFSNKGWKECWLYRRGFEVDVKTHDDVTSVSGWTKKMYGYPTKDWFKRMNLAPLA